MGQAFDRDGNVLGDAEGATKREVFEKLNQEFKDAAEIRIKSMEPGLMAGVSRPADHVAERVDPGPARSVAEHVETLEHMARYRRDGRTGTRSVADLAEAESCDAGAAALRELIEMNQILARIGKRGG